MSSELPEGVKARRRKLREEAAHLGLAIGGCGCCGSPWLKDTITGKFYDHEGYIYEPDPDEEVT